MYIIIQLFVCACTGTRTHVVGGIMMKSYLRGTPKLCKFDINNKVLTEEQSGQFMHTDRSLLLQCSWSHSNSISIHCIDGT